MDYENSNYENINLLNEYFEKHGRDAKVIETKERSCKRRKNREKTRKS